MHNVPFAGNTQFAFATDVLNNALFVVDVVAGTSQKVLQFEVRSAGHNCVQTAKHLSHLTMPRDNLVNQHVCRSSISIDDAA